MYLSPPYLCVYGGGGRGIKQFCAKDLRLPHYKISLIFLSLRLQQMLVVLITNNKVCLNYGFSLYSSETTTATCLNIFYKF